MRAFDRWRRLDANERRLALRSVVVLSRAILMLRMRGVQRALRWAHREVNRAESSKPAVSGIVDSVERAGRYVPGATCLAKSLALARLLRATGVVASVRIGVGRASNFAAHAWVECDGVALTRSNGAETLPTGPQFEARM